MELKEKYDFIIEATLFELKENPEIRKKVRYMKLVGAAYSRVKNAGFLKVCNRCGGTGEYSFNLRDGKRCFKCGGSKYMFPRMTKAWKESVTAYDWRKFMADKSKAN